MGRKVLNRVAMFDDDEKEFHGIGSIYMVRLVLKESIRYAMFACLVCMASAAPQVYIRVRGGCI